MNYRHAFHAGNFADVLKHVVLARVLDYMKRKDAPFRVIDTHAGIGRYDLASTEAAKTGEWQDGIARLVGPHAWPFSPGAKELLKPYLDAVLAENGGRGLARYPGSPRVALRLMRPQDTLVANELHPDDAKTLKHVIGRDPRARVLMLDAAIALRAQLPPKERRGVVLIDPPFEQPGEFERIAQSLAEGLERFASGTFLVWYPIKDRKAVEKWQRTLKVLKSDKIVAIDVFVRPPVDADVLNGCGLIVVNGPFTLLPELDVLLPELVASLSQNRDAQFKISDIFTGKVVSRQVSRTDSGSPGS